ncbi:uncharacterized protein N7483_005048 [Penicillium malachiteum]|uniref:uncharacterized protein n=1 Tax=Penicillium malachiteum TaxID=1324776 RepID=UPI0025470645|nr:uncharacterized protein N7483_005048 [Penicillium malachiteum]KAJ5730540.1 hypothetical protein N7483_005048 [Penicillium malachiteum]
MVMIPVLGYGTDCIFKGDIATSYHPGYLSFLGRNLAAITYAIDSFPEQIGPLLLVIREGRGSIAFGLSYSTVPITDQLGYDGAMNIYAMTGGVFFGLGVPSCIFGE